jgi:acetoacetyl-CoA synthetase
MAPGATLDDELRSTITTRISARLSPRHVPDSIVAAPAVPRTLTGKKLEVPVKRLLQGDRMEDAVAFGAVDDVAALHWYAQYGVPAETEIRS